MKMYAIHILSIALLFSACDMEIDKTGKTALPDTITANRQIVDSLLSKSLDSTILLSGLSTTNNDWPELTSIYAKEILYSHFKSKGYYTDDHLPNIVNAAGGNNNKLAVAFDSIFIADLNGSKNPDAIITYWLTPPYANGRCWQPHKAIIADTDKGYTITNQEFIPTNFAIDSVAARSHDISIYGYDYDCANNRVLRNFQLRVK